MPEIVAVDLTAFQPLALDDEGRTTAIWPAFCLPWYPGEPPIVGEAAQRHRRASQAVGVGPEWNLDLQNRARFHLAEGWLEMTREPDSLVSSGAHIEWHPPGENRRVSIGFSQVIEAVLHPWNGSGMDLALVVPDGLGPGPREEILSRLSRGFRSIQFVPRTIAAASSWCGRQELQKILQDRRAAPGDRVGSLFVTTSPADTWEAALVPIRLEGSGRKARLCPVYERTTRQSEIGVVGLELQPGVQSVKSADAEQAWWLRLLGRPDLADIPGALTSDSAAVSEMFRARTLPQQLNRHWSPTNARGAALDAVAAAESQGQIIDWLHVAHCENAQVPVPLLDLADYLGPPSIVHPSTLLPSALDVPRRVAQGETPYYESLARIDMYVEARNAYHDPVSSWRPLIEATEVPVGTRYRSPDPITDLGLPGGKQPKVDIFIRSHRRGKALLGTVRATQRDPQDEPDQLRIEATLDPGQGMSRIDVSSQEGGRFRITVREADLRPVEAHPELRYAWPRGSAWVVSHPQLERNAWAAITMTRWRDMTTREFTCVRNTMNVWKRPEEFDEEGRKFSVPKEIHPAFVYLGAFPSHSESWTDELRHRAAEYGSSLEEIYRQNRFQKPVLWNASWLYSECPEHLLDEVRRQLRDPAALNEAALAVVGNCFISQRDHRAYFSSLVSSILSGAGPADQYWIRAYRNLARFRAKALSLDVMSPEEQSLVVRWYLEVFEESMENRRSIIRPIGNHPFLHCAYLAPHILKRRRFDSQFLEVGSKQYQQVNATYERALSLTQAPKLKTNLQSALKFLQRTATEETIRRLGQNES